MARPVAPAVHRSFRFPAELWARIEQRAAEMSAADPTMKYTPADAVRDALEKALPPLRAEDAPVIARTTKTPRRPAKRRV